MGVSVDSELLEVIIPYTMVAVILLLANKSFRGVASLYVLAGLVFAYLSTGEVSVAPDAASSRKQQKKLQQQMKAARSASPSLMWQHVTPRLLLDLEFSEDFDIMLMGCAVFIFSAVTEVLMRVFITPKVSHNFIGISLAGFFFVLSFLIKVEWAHPIITKADKFYMLFAGLLGTLLSFWLLMHAPRELLDFNTAGATNEFLGRLQGVMQSRKAVLEKLSVEPLQLSSTGDPVFLSLLLAVFAGALGGLLLAPGLRYGRILHMMLKPPMWARKSAENFTIMKLSAQLGITAQLLIVPLWSPTLTDALFIPRGVLPYLRGVGLLLVAVLQGVAVPQLAQTFLLTAPYQAVVIEHEPDLASDPAKRTTLLKAQCKMSLMLLCKAAMQVSFLPILLVLCSCLHILMSFTSPQAATHPRATEWDKQPSVLYQTVAGYLGWWSSLAMLAWTVLGVTMARLAGMD